IQGVPRRVLTVVLSMEQGDKSQKQQQPAQQKQLAPRAAAPATQSAPASAPAGGESNAPKIAQAFSIVAEESGPAITDFTANTVFADSGIDTLLGMIISVRFKEELDINFDFNAMLSDYPTVSALKAFLGGDEQDSTGTSSVSSSTGPSSTPRSSATGNTTPATEHGSLAPTFHFLRAVQIISEESGLATEDLIDDTAFVDVGVDSLSFVIVSRMRDELDIQHESLFMEPPTVGDLRKFLIGDTKANDSAQPLEETKPIPAPTPEPVQGSRERSNSNRQRDSCSCRPQEGCRRHVQKYTAGFTAPVPLTSLTAPYNNANVVLVTGASGGLGGHLVD
ncbi:MAG: hypothetical protein Q9196_005982, partial [Gyalolechia fulgens]